MPNQGGFRLARETAGKKWKLAARRYDYLLHLLHQEMYCHLAVEIVSFEYWLSFEPLFLTRSIRSRPRSSQQKVGSKGSEYRRKNAPFRLIVSTTKRRETDHFEQCTDRRSFRRCLNSNIVRTGSPLWSTSQTSPAAMVKSSMQLDAYSSNLILQSSTNSFMPSVNSKLPASSLILWSILRPY